MADTLPRNTPHTARSGKPQRTHVAFTSAAHARRYWLLVLGLLVASVLIAFGSLAWDNPLPFGSKGFWTIAELRAQNLVVIVVVAFCQSLATVAFQTVTNNRILTPSIMGFESLYRLIQTAAVFVLGAAGATVVRGEAQFLIQVLLMVGFAAAIYGPLLTGRRADLQLTLLIGIVLGGGLGAISTFLQRLLTPSEFDLLTARLIGSVANADASLLVIALPLVLVAGVALLSRSQVLNVMSLGREASVNLGINHRRQTMLILLLCAALVAVSTALIGPMTFFGFLVAMLAYQIADTSDHRFIFPIAWLTGFVVLGGAHFVLKHIFYASGSVGIIIEIIGGTAFLIHILRKGRL